MRFAYKSGVSITNQASQRQKWHLVYKNSVVDLQSGVFDYKTAPPISIQRAFLCTSV